MKLTIAILLCTRKECLEREQQFMEDKKRKKEDKRKRETSQKVRMLCTLDKQQVTYSGLQVEMCH